MLRPALVILVAVMATCAIAADRHEAPHLATILTPAEFQRAGLQKLSAAELQALEAALASHHFTAASAADAAAARSKVDPARTFGSEQIVQAAPSSTPKELRSHIEGTLHEFSGRAVFVLENGQIWQQRMPESFYFAQKLVNPEVVITKGFGGYKMTIVPADCVVFVKRIR